MRKSRRLIIAFALLPPVIAPAFGQDDLFDFIAPGGRTLVESLAAAGDVSDLVGRSGSRADFDAALAASDNPAIADLGPADRATLADYLAHVAPFDPVSPPRDGRDLALEYCQSCHIITVVVTQDRSRDAWLGTMHKPSHIEVDLTEAEREQLADYLVLNGGIPIDLVPEDLRAGGASY
jgi:mono/diheme cytochrome c family protein